MPAGLSIYFKNKAIREVRIKRKNRQVWKASIFTKAVRLILRREIGVKVREQRRTTFSCYLQSVRWDNALAGLFLHFPTKDLALIYIPLQLDLTVKLKTKLMAMFESNLEIMTKLRRLFSSHRLCKNLTRVACYKKICKQSFTFIIQYIKL
jgi:hypothetical protein